MKSPGVVFLVIAACCGPIARGADATAPIDYTQRNTPFAPAADATVTPEKKTPQTNAGIQDKRFDKTIVDKQTSPLGERRAGIDVKETREKQVREKNSHRPEVREQPTSSFNHRTAPITTSEDKVKPPTVAKYQDSLTSASASNMARFPALDRATGAKINRFVFRKNPPDPASSAAAKAGASTATEGKTVIPAAGGSAVLK